MRLSIRWRLTLWNAVALSLGLLAFSVLVYYLLEHALYQRVDQVLRTEFGRLEDDPGMSDARDKRLRYWIHEFDEHEKILAVVYDAQGQVHLRTEKLATDSIPTAPQTVGPAPSLRDEAIPLLGRQRLLAGRLRLGDQDFTVVMMASLHDVDRELKELRGALSLAVPIALALAAALGYVLARKSLAPMDRIVQVTKEITADRLERRLPVDNPNDELGRLAHTINHMIGRLERSFAEVRRFTADASHELRTPLTAIRTEAEVALRKPLTPDEQKHLLGSILEECARLTHLTDQLLTLSRQDAGLGRQKREAADLAPLLSQVTETMRPLAEAKGLQLRADGNGPVMIQGDAEQLRQVFYNLLDNAIKYTSAGTIQITLETQDHAAVVTVKDSGVGIPAEHLSRVFDRFYRADTARGRAQGGAGLGLSIAQSIVAAHGGRIELTSQPGRGTTCSVFLPLKVIREPDASLH